MTTPSFSRAPALVHLLYTQNPFYLIGTLLVLLGLQQSLGRDPSLETSGMLTVMLACYTLLLAGMAAIIVRCGQVWDDARTILLVIVLLFLMLSASLDYQLLDDPLPGTGLLAAGLAFSLLLSEWLLRGLQIHLAARYRTAYYLMLTLLFVYPAAVAWISYYRLYAMRAWSLFAFSGFAALALLALLPAARATAKQEPPSGTPWRWPYYPWSLFVYLTIGVVIRAWWLTVSFDTAKGNDTCFRPFFLLPLFLAWGVLLIEMGRARSRRWTIATGLALPLAGLALAFGGPPQNPADAAFLQRLVAAVGSPPQLAVYTLLLFYAWAWLRGERLAEACLFAVGLLASVVGRETWNLDTLTSPQMPVLAFVAAAFFATAVYRESTWRALAGGGAAVVAAFFADVGAAAGEAAWFWQWHAPALALLAVAIAFNDPFAAYLRAIAWRATPLLALAAAIVYPWALPGVSAAMLATYVGLLLAASAGLWSRQREVAPLGAVLATALANVLAHLQQLYLLLEQTRLAGGLPWLAVGMLAVGVAFFISLLKMGVWQRGAQWLGRINGALGGVPMEPV